MDDFEEENTKKNPSNRKPISYFTEFRLDINLNNFVRKLCAAMINEFQGIFWGEKGRGAKVLQTYRHTYRPSDEAGPRGAFAPKKTYILSLTTLFCIGVI